MSRLRTPLIATALVGFLIGAARADVDPILFYDLPPSDDTYATHNDGIVHGAEEIIRVGIEPQQCIPDGWNPCEDDDMECCVLPDDYNFCSVPGQCGAADPLYPAHRKFRGYVRFDLSALEDGWIESAFLSFKEARTVSLFGGPPHIEVYRLKSIGVAQICAWDEATLNDTDRTTWSSLPQNVAITPEGRWSFDVTKAVRDWVNGDADQFGSPIQPNCGFHLADPDFGRESDPIARWVDFSSKEGTSQPLLTIRLALDIDQDGYFGDCDETDPNIHPGATELCDSVDNDCDGATDEEDCDGLDNDCDGETDEGDDLCGPGQACIYHECIITCEDDCSGPHDLMCRLGDDQIWERWACADVDDDPCLDWYFVEDCAPDEFCDYGYCSFNCVDECDPDQEGVTDCYQDSVGRWFLATCGDADGDGCLEWGHLHPCGPASECQDATCVGGCEDECDSMNLTECEDDHTVRACYDSDGDGCLEWTQVAICASPAELCDAGQCVATCEDICEAGQTRCLDEDAEARSYDCVLEGGETPCYDWGEPTPCAYGCSDDHTTCAGAPQEEVALPDVVAPREDVVSADVAATDIVTAELPSHPDIAAPPDGSTSDDAPPSEPDVAMPPPKDSTTVSDDTTARADAGTTPAPDGGMLIDLGGGNGDGAAAGRSGSSGGCQMGEKRPAQTSILVFLIFSLLAMLALRRRRA